MVTPFAAAAVWSGGKAGRQYHPPPPSLKKACRSADLSVIILIPDELRFLVPPVEFVDPARRINEFLLTGEEGMALGADADLHLGTGRLDVPHLAAGAGDDGVALLGMNIFFHS